MESRLFSISEAVHGKSRCPLYVNIHIVLIYTKAEQEEPGLNRVIDRKEKLCSCFVWFAGKVIFWQESYYLDRSAEKQAPLITLHLDSFPLSIIAMAFYTNQKVTTVLLVLNLVLYFIIITIAAWAVNHGIQRSRETASALSVPLQIFPIYFPFGNMSTGFFVIYTLLAGVVGMATSHTGLEHVRLWDISEIHDAAASSMVTWSLTLLAMGLACKEINLGYTNSNLVSPTSLYYI
ncbi:uncharacterized protein LOC120012657 [Tripterygium wilfordii]|uniref:uncharacterized protein LOC120012657 n=1 Tax=Tripterygium wilfordii TaxID=458696 RepID=UPI0018F80F0A|nr:uncharacterized protein LOC120012657 [Tripterygium wilfordii]